MGFITFDYDEFDYTDHETILDLYDDLCERDRLHLHAVVLTRYNVDLDVYYEQVFGEAPLHIREPNFEKDQKLEQFQGPQTKIIYFDNDIVTGSDLDWDEDIITAAVRPICDAAKISSEFGNNVIQNSTNMDCDITQSLDLNGDSDDETFLMQSTSLGEVEEASDQNFVESKSVREHRTLPLPAASNALAPTYPISNNPISSVDSQSTHINMQGVKRFCQVSGKLIRCGKSNRRVYRDNLRKWSRNQANDEARGFILQSDSIEEDPHSTNMDIQLDGVTTTEGEPVYKYHVQGCSVKATKSQRIAKVLASERSIEYVFNDFHIVIDEGGGESQSVAKSVARFISDVFYGT